MTLLQKAAILAAFCLLTMACGDPAAEKQQQALNFLTSWYQQASDGAREDALCHGLGLLKHPAISCEQMLGAAARVDPATRTIEGIHPQECFASVCGEFLEFRFASRDLAGNDIQETALLKRDEGKFRMYWYRNDALLEELRRSQPQSNEDEKDPVQVAYDKLVARYPSLYSYPPCHGARASSSTLAGKLISLDDVDINLVEQLASRCPEVFCFSLVGQKIAPLCPSGG